MLKDTFVSALREPSDLGRLPVKLFPSQKASSSLGKLLKMSGNSPCRQPERQVGKGFGVASYESETGEGQCTAGLHARVGVGTQLTEVAVELF